MARARNIDGPTREKPRRLTGLVLGLVLCAVGGAGLAALAALSFCDGEACRAWALRLGLAYGPLASAAAQTALLVGVLLIWRSLRARRSRRPDA